MYGTAAKSLLVTLPGMTVLEPAEASGAIAAAIGGAPAESLLLGAALADGPEDGGGGGAALKGVGGGGAIAGPDGCARSA